MKNKRIASWIKIAGAALFAGIFAFTGIPGNSIAASKVQAANTGTIYYGFTEITSIGSMRNNNTYMFLTEKYSVNDAVVAIPSGSARLTLTAVPASGGNSDRAVTTDAGVTATQGNVHVEQSGKGFDGCMDGHIGYLTRSGRTGWYYGCDAGGATNVGPFYVYSYTTASFSESDITVEVTDAFDVPTSKRFYTDSNDLTGLLVKIRVNGREFNVPYFTVATRDNSVDPATGDTSVILNIGGVEKQAELKCKQAAPAGQTDYTTGELKGLTPNGTYVITVDGKKETITADENGNLDLTPYAGKTIIITKPGNGGNVEDSESQTIEVKKSESAPEEKEFGTRVEGDQTIISGVGAGKEYSLDGGKTWISGTGDDIVIPTGTDIQIRTKATQDTPASEIVGLKYKNETPNGTPDYTEGKLTGLRPNDKYILKVNGKEIEVIADTEGKIDLKPYAGKTIEIMKPGNGDNLLESDSQIISVKPSAVAPKKDDYKVIVNGAYTNISGITEDQEYSVDGGKTWINGTGETIRVKTGEEVQIRVKATKDEPGSEIVRVKTVGEGTNLTIGGMKDSNGNPCAGAEVELRNGVSVIATTTTAEDGSFAFVGVPEGIYNLVVKHDGKTETYIVKIANGKINLEEITVDAGNLNSTISIKEGTPAIIVGNIQSQFDTIVEDTNKGYTKEDDAIVKAGGSAEINVNISTVQADVNNARYITQVASKDGMKIGNFIDIIITKIVTDLNGKQTKTGLIELPKVLTFYLDIESDMQGKASYVVYRYHQNYIDTITTTPNEDGEYIEVSEDGTKLILHVKKFSTYAIGYSTEAKTVDNKSVSVQSLVEKVNTPVATPVVKAAPVVEAAPKTGDNTPVVPFTVVSVAALAILILNRKTKVVVEKTKNK